MSETQVRNPNPQSAPNDGAPESGAVVPFANERETDRGLDREELLQKIIGWHKIDRDHFQPWRQEAAECYDFRAGHQWSDEDLQILQDQTRPAITFNRIGPFVDAVGGLEINNRQETRYMPRTVGDSGVNDLLTGAAQWARGECDAEDEETESFLDVVTCGIGCIQTRMDYDDEPDGMIRMDRINPLEMLPDSGARKQNFADARRVMRIKDIPISEACDLFPDVDEYELHADWAMDQPDEARTPHNARIAPFYRIDQSGRNDHEQQLVRMVEVEWTQFCPAWRVLDPTTGRYILLDDAKAMRYATVARLAGYKPKMIRDRRKKYYKAIVGASVLKIMDGADNGGFSYKFITGKRDLNKGHWYGLVRAMRDPQMWANKWLSQGLHIVNTNAKGGLLAETDAFADIDEARDDWAAADSITELNPGGLNKIQQKQPPAFPPQLNVMMELATQAIPMVSGINMELMGQSTSNAPQVALLEQGRKQQGMNVLAALFNAKRRYQKEQGRLLLWMIQTFIADGRLIRIGGPENAQYVPLVHTPGLAEYDVIVDDAPTSTNMKDRVWSALMQMFPMLRGMAIPPQFYINAMKYAPIPESFVKESQSILSEPPPANPAMEAKGALEAARAASEKSRGELYAAQIAQAQAQAIKTQAEANKTAAEIVVMQQKMPLEDDNMAANIELTRAKAINELQNAGLVSDDFQFQQTMKAIDALLSVHRASVDHDLHMHKKKQDEQEFDDRRWQAAMAANSQQIQGE